MKLIVAIPGIGAMNFQSFDLNLLRILDSLLILRNTTRVGEAVGLSQPAVSAALRRLRDVLGDPILVREGNLLVPTDFALSLQEPVHSALLMLEDALSGGGGFDPARLDRSFVIAASDYFQEMLIPKLAASLSAAAPNVRLKVLPPRSRDLAAMLTSGSFDLALSIDVETPGWITRMPVFRASNAVVARRGHPYLGGLQWGDRLPLDVFCGLPHVIFSVNEEFAHMEDAALARLDRSRHVQLSVAGYHGVGRAVAESDLLGVLPTRFALSVAKMAGISVFRLPFDEPLIGMFLYWRERETRSRELSWLRNMIVEQLAPFDETNAPVTDAEFSLASRE